MTQNEHLLQVLAEECNEVAHRVSKALRFGLSEVQEGQKLTNAERIMEEANDLMGAIVLLQTNGILPDFDPDAIAAKQERIKLFGHYSIRLGTLTEDPKP